jgi:pimeloyl-ACP methyl ester carboxylesterase
VADTDLRHEQIDVDGGALHVVEAGDPKGRPVLFLHGWPQSWQCWAPVLKLAAADGARAIAIDLPGIGGSQGVSTDGSKLRIAEILRSLVTRLKLTDLTLVGQDAGGMVAYAYLRSYPDLARAVIMDVVIPGVEPWDEVRSNPYLWHFAFHATPGLPEKLVRGRLGIYFDFFLDYMATDPAKITRRARAEYRKAYNSDEALKAGFDWYRTFDRDAEDNRVMAKTPCETPVLYVRGEHDRAEIDRYLAGFRDAGLSNVEYGCVPGAGHFAQEEEPAQTWRVIGGFLRG